MAITSITRDWGTSAPNLVRIVASDTLSQVAANGYMLAQSANITSVNNGAFDFLYTDIIMIAAADGQGMFRFVFDESDPQAPANFHSLYPLPGSSAQVSKAVTAAQWLGMYAAPIKIVDAPGAGLMIIVKRAEIIMDYGTAAMAAGGVTGFQYGSTTHLAGPLATNTEAAADFQATANTVFAFNGVSGNTVGALPVSSCGNVGIYMSNQSGAYTTGDSTFVINVDYSIIATP
jgi:hypothetical protein